jgi:hypothetical protein
MKIVIRITQVKLLTREALDLHHGDDLSWWMIILYVGRRLLNINLARQSNDEDACRRVSRRSQAALQCCILDSRANRNRVGRLTSW